MQQADTEYFPRGLHGPKPVQPKPVQPESVQPELKQLLGMPLLPPSRDGGYGDPLGPVQLAGLSHRQAVVPDGGSGCIHKMYCLSVED